MTKKELIKKLEIIDDNQEIFMTPNADDAYPASVRLFKENGKIIPYFKIDIKAAAMGNHRNYPNDDKEIK